MISSPNSYFTAEEAKQISKPVYIFTLDEYEVPQEDIIDPGQVTLERPIDFSGLMSGDHTLTLNNADGLYSPGRSTFIWDGETWYRRPITIEIGYYRAGYQGIIDKVLIYQGLITEWKVSENKDYSHDAPSEGLIVEITSRDHISLLAELKVGAPDANGYPNPLVCGKVVKSAIALDNRVFWSPTDTINYETNNLTQWDYTEITGTGSFAASGTSPYAGSYCGRHQVSGAGDDAYGRQDIGGGSGIDSIHVSAWIKFVTVPGSPVNLNYAFMGIMNTGGARFVSVLCTNTGKLILRMYGTVDVNTDWSPADYPNIWVKFDLMINIGTPGYVRLFVNNSEIAVIQGVNIVATSLRYGYVGLDSNAGIAETWDIYTDDVLMYDVAYPLGYYLPGGSYAAINRVYQDVTLLPIKKDIKPFPQYYFNWGNNGGYWIGQLLIPGNTMSPDNYDINLTYGLVDFKGLGDKPSGNVSFEAVKDTNTHPVDIIESVLTAISLDDLIDAANFAAVKADIPDDIIGGYFEDMTAAQALSQITGVVLYDIVERQGAIGLINYTGIPLVSSVITLNRSNCHSMQHDFTMDDMKTKVVAKWGWYEKDPTLLYQPENTILETAIGVISIDLDMTFGSDVSTDDATMARAKADLLLKRFNGPIEQITATGSLSLARIELGDGVLIQNLFNDTDQIYEVVGKLVDLTNKTVEIKANIYTGEEESMMEVLGTF